MALSFSFNAISGNFDLISTVTIGTANGLSITDEQVLSLALSSTSTTGALSSTNWNTFNNKFDLPALTSGSVLFSDGTTIAQDNTYLYYDSVTHTLRVGNTGTEGSGIDVNGTTYESTFKVSDIDGTNFAQTILHRHSTTLEPLIVGARSNSNTSAHTAVTNNMNLFSIYGVGITGTNYKLFGSMSIASSSSGTISGTSAPGKFTFSTTPNGSLIPATVLTLDQDRSATFTGDVGITSMTAGSVLFSGASGVVSQDNSNLFFDNTNNRLGIGTATPRGLLDVVASSTSGDIHIEAQRGSGVDPKNIFLRPGYDTSSQSNGAVYIGQGPFTGSEAQGAQFCLEENADIVQARFSNLKNTGFVYNIYSNDLSQFGAIGVAGSAIPEPGYNSRLFIENSNLGGIAFIMNGGDIGFFDQGANPAVVSINSAGETSIGAASANISAILDVTSTTKGFLKPRMTTTQRNAIASTATGLEVFDTTLGRSYYYDGSAWRQVMPNPMTTGGDLVYGGTSGTATRLANGSAGHVLTSSGGTAAPVWSPSTPGYNYTARTTTYTAAIGDYVNCTSGTFTVTLPTAVGNPSKSIFIKNSGTGLITIATTSSQTIDGITSFKLPTQYEYINVVSDGANWMISSRYYSTASVAFSGTFGSGFGTIANNNLRQYRQGEYLVIRGTFDTGTVTTAAPILTMPYTVDTTKINTTAFKQSFGRGWRHIGSGSTTSLTSGSSADIDYVLTYNGTTNQLQIVRSTGSTTSGGTFVNDQTSSIMGNSTTVLIENIMIPIQDWV